VRRSTAAVSGSRMPGAATTERRGSADRCWRRMVRCAGVHLMGGNAPPREARLAAARRVRLLRAPRRPSRWEEAGRAPTRSERVRPHEIPRARLGQPGDGTARDTSSSRNEACSTSADSNAWRNASRSRIAAPLRVTSRRRWGHASAFGHGSFATRVRTNEEQPRGCVDRVERGAHLWTRPPTDEDDPPLAAGQRRAIERQRRRARSPTGPAAVPRSAPR
jgi:hypothetical protein